LIGVSFLIRILSRSVGLKGGSKEQGLEKEGRFTRVSIINLVAKSWAGQANSSKQSSVAFGGMVGLKVKSLEYSFRL